jgi:hypothetical protein
VEGHGRQPAHTPGKNRERQHPLPLTGEPAKQPCGYPRVNPSKTLPVTQKPANLAGNILLFQYRRVPAKAMTAQNAERSTAGTASGCS